MPLAKRILATALLSVALATTMFSMTALADGGQTAPCDANLPTPCQPGQGQDSITLPNPLGKQTDPLVIIGLVIRVVLGVVGSIALVLFIYGGLVMMTSAGNTDRVAQGRNTLVWAAIGLMVIFSSYTIVGFLLKNIPQ